MYLVSRPARALWIEITGDVLMSHGANRRGPRGPCGLKSLLIDSVLVAYRSRPTRALWIEIQDGTGLNNINTSRPARALWIEIAVSIAPCPTIVVEAREGLVD